VAPTIYFSKKEYCFRDDYKSALCPASSSDDGKPEISPFFSPIKKGAFFQ